MKFKIKFLGSGSKYVLNSENFHSNILFEFEKENKTERILFDVSPNILEMLNYFDLNFNDIQGIIISHLHSSHYGGLEILAKLKYFNFSCKKKPETRYDLIIPKELKKPLWKSLKHSLQSINGKRLNLNDYFNVIEVSPNQPFKINDVEFYFVKVPHIIDNKKEMPSFGLRFNYNNKKILITGDTQFDYWRFLGFYETYDIIFHDCEFENYANSHHAQFNDLKNLYIDYKNKIYLYHYKIPQHLSLKKLEQLVKKEGFKGIIKRGDEFEF